MLHVPTYCPISEGSLDEHVGFDHLSAHLTPGVYSQTNGNEIHTLTQV